MNRGSTVPPTEPAPEAITRKRFLSLLAMLGLATRGSAQDRPVAKPEKMENRPAAIRALVPTTTGTPAVPDPQPGPPYLLAGPMLGHVTATEARVWIRATAPGSWSLRIAESPDLAGAREIAGPMLGPQATGTVAIDGLRPATRYFYDVLLSGRSQLVRPWPSFVSAPVVGTRGRVRVAFGSCVGTAVADAACAWAELAARREYPEAGGFDLLLMLGDNHYGDTVDPAKHRTYLTAHRQSAGWREFSARAPVYAIWDDHDFAGNNSDGTVPGKEDLLAVFHEFWPNPACAAAEGDGIYFTFVRGDVQVFMLDGRYRRSPDLAPDGPEKTMLGARQISWFKEELRKSSARIKLLATGSQWESYGSVDSFRSYRQERDELLGWIDAERIEGVILLSGDRHCSAGFQVAGRFVELSSSPWGSKNLNLIPSPECFTAAEVGQLWMVLDIDTTPAEPRVTYELWRAGLGLLERRSLSWDAVNGREKIGRSPPL